MIREDQELAAWMDDWQSEETRTAPDPVLDPAAILRQVKRRSLGLKLLTAGEVLLAAGALIGLTLFALRHRDPIDVAVMASFCLLTLAALALALWNRRGLWKPAAETTAAYLALARNRARRRQEALRAAWGLLAAETALFIPWIWHTLHADGGHPGPLSYTLAYGYLALVAGAMAALLAWLERWTRRERARLDVL
jgi:apolipoprotein N-acyltransferase